jgi:protein-S-isoprenylcysteine O-methyltransferase Ste14
MEFSNAATSVEDEGLKNHDIPIFLEQNLNHTGLMSYLLVSLQFILIVWLIWPLAAVSPVALSLWWSLSPAKFLIVVVGLVSGFGLFAWSYLSMPRESFTIMPEPRDGNQLCERGPYLYVRHPMYTSVLICAIAAAYGYAHAAKWWAVPVLLAVLWVKLKREEGYLLQKHGSSYADYMLRTKALVPFVV